MQFYSNLTQVAEHYNTTFKRTLKDTMYINTCHLKIWEKSPIVDSTKIADAIEHSTYFIEGLGGPYYTKREPQGPVYSEFLLTYFKKPNLTCGTFITANVKHINNLNISVYPNPTKGNVTIKSEHALKNATLNLYNLNGQLVHFNENINSNSIELQRNSLPSGIYLLQISDQKSVFNTKLIFE